MANAVSTLWKEHTSAKRIRGRARRLGGTKVRLSSAIPRGLHQDLRVMALVQDTTIAEILEISLARELERRMGIPGIAARVLHLTETLRTGLRKTQAGKGDNRAHLS